MRVNDVPVPFCKASEFRYDEWEMTACDPNSDVQTDQAQYQNRSIVQARTITSNLGRIVGGINVEVDEEAALAKSCQRLRSQC